MAAPEPAASPKQLKQARRAVEIQLDRLEQSAAEQKKLQARLNNNLYDLQRQLAAIQIQIRQVEEQATATAQKIAEGEKTLSTLKQDVTSLGVRTPAAGESPKQLAEQKQKIEDQQTILKQRETEIRDLRQALAARDEMMKAQGRNVAVPPPAVTSAPVKNISAPAAPTNNAVQMVAEGHRLLQAGNAAEAEKKFSSALVQDPRLISARFGLASCLYSRGELPAAKKLADEVIKAEPRNADALGLAGIIAWKQNDLKPAADLLERAIRQAPKDAQLHNYLGIIRYAQGKRSPAVKELETAVALNPNLAEANFNLAVILATDQHPQLDKARQYYQASLRLGNARDEKLEGILYP